eukprot:9603981-Lingulodinium_polyedra.AAC.1
MHNVVTRRAQPAALASLSCHGTAHALRNRPCIFDAQTEPLTLLNAICVAVGAPRKRHVAAH